MKKLSWFMFLMLLFIGVSGQAGATLYTFNFSGHVTDDGGISELTSNTFTGSFTYNTSATNTASDPTTFGTYTFDPSGLNGISVVFSSGVTFETDPTEPVGVDIQNASILDKLVIGSSYFYQSNISSVISIEENWLNVVFGDNTGSALPNTNLPTSLDLSAWNESREIVAELFNPDITSGGLVYVYGEIDTLSASPVPEPATLLLFGAGLVGLVGIGRKKYFKK